MKRPWKKFFLKYKNDILKNSKIFFIKGGDIDDLVQYAKPSINFYSLEDILIGKELVEMLGKFLNKNLTPLEKKVFFYTCKQYKYYEIAKILEEPSKKIDNAIQRVRKKILEYLLEYTRD